MEVELKKEKDLNMENKEVYVSDQKGSSSSEISSAIEGLSILVKALKSENHGGSHAEVHDVQHDDKSLQITMPTKHFLSLCNDLVLQVLDKIGPTMAVLRQDVHQNIQRLEMLQESDPLMYSNLVEIIKKEVSEGIARKGASCSKAFVWLTRSLDFTVALLQKLVKDPGQNMEQAVEEAYDITLKPWHRWISSAAFRVCLKLVPDKQTFVSVLSAKNENFDTLKEEMQTLILLLVPFLEEIHAVLRFYDLDRIKST